MQNTIHTKSFTLEKVLNSAKSLSIEDKIKLIQIITSQIEIEFKTQNIKPKKSLRGLWKGIHIKEQDIKEIRKEMWQQFPREDF